MRHLRFFDKPFLSEEVLLPARSRIKEKRRVFVKTNQKKMFKLLAICASLAVVASGCQSVVELAPHSHNSTLSHDAEDLADNLAAHPPAFDPNAYQVPVVDSSVKRPELLGPLAVPTIQAMPFDPSSNPADRAQIGGWSIKSIAKTELIHIALEPKKLNQILMFGRGIEPDEAKPGSTTLRSPTSPHPFGIYDLTTRTMSVTATSYWAFCGINIWNLNGDLEIHGGHAILPGEKGLPNSNIVKDGVVSQIADMPFGSWYPGGMNLGNGKTFLYGGADINGRINYTSLTYDSAANTYTQYPGTVPNNKAYLDNIGSPFYYTWLFQRANGDIAKIGPEKERATVSLTANNNQGSFTYDVTATQKRENGLFAVLQPGVAIAASGREQSDLDKAIKPSTKTAELINTNTNQTITQLPNLLFPHNNGQLVPLPSGEVIAINGCQTLPDNWKCFDNPSLVSRTPEILNKTKTTWTALAANPLPLNEDANVYHSTTMLLPDAGIFVGGGQYYDGQFRIFYPPNLFKKDGSGQFADRPQWYQDGQTDGVPDSVPFARRAFEVRMASKADAFKIVDLQPNGKRTSARCLLQAVPSQTHGITFNYHRIPCGVSEATWSYTNPANPDAGPFRLEIDFSGPINQNEMAPGYYMLFLLDSNDVPAIARSIRIY